MPAESLQIRCRHVVGRTAYFQTHAPARPCPRSGPTQMRAVRFSTAVGSHVGRFKGVWQASESGFWVKKPVKTPEERLRNARETAETLHTPFKHDRAHHMGAMDHRGQ